MSAPGGKKLRRSRPHLFKDTPKVNKGPLHKKNGPKSRLPTWEPIPSLVAYYKVRG